MLYVAQDSYLADDYTPPTIDTTGETPTTGGLDFSVQTTPSSPDDQVAEVIVLYTDADNPAALDDTCP